MIKSVAKTKQDSEQNLRKMIAIGIQMYHNFFAMKMLVIFIRLIDFSLEYKMDTNKG